MGDKQLLERFGVKPHATRRLASIYVGCGTLAGVIALAAESVGGALAAATMGTLLIGTGVWMRVAGNALQIVNRALLEATSGRDDNATALLDYIEPRTRQSSVRRAIDFQRAQLALKHLRFEDALAFADASVERAPGLLTRIHEQAHAVTARGLRAVIHASLDNRDAATADIEAVRESQLAFPEAFSRAELAAAMLLERRREHEALREHLQRSAHVLLNHTTPRERAIVRAYQRMLQAKPQSVYRKRPGERPAGDGEPPLHEWVAQLAPGAAEFVRGHGGDEAPAPAVDVPAASEVSAAGKRVEALAGTRSRGWRVLLLWLLLIIVFLSIWTLLSPNRRGSAPASQEALVSIPVYVVPGLLLAVLVGWFTRLLVGSHRQMREIVVALGELARDRRVSAVATLQRLKSSNVALVAAQAHAALSGVALRDARLDDALSLANDGVKSLSKGQRALASDWLLPDLLSQRAAMLAARGKLEEARAELAHLAESFSSYPFMGRARLRIALMAAAYADDVAAAAKLADQVAEIALSAQEELLLDIARAAVHGEGAGAGEVARLRAALRDDPEARRWLDTVAPAFAPAFEEATRIEAAIVRVASGEPPRG